jgi:hypothetical protein
MCKRRVARDRIDPGSERRAAIKRLQRLPHLEKRILRDLLRTRRIPDHREHQTIHLCLIKGQDLLERTIPLSLLEQPLDVGIHVVLCTRDRLTGLQQSFIQPNEEPESINGRRRKQHV